MQLPDVRGAGALGARLRAVGYTVEGVTGLLGPVAARAVDRDDVVPALRVLASDRSPLAVATLLFLLDEPVTTTDAHRLLDGVDVGGLLAGEADSVRSWLELAPYGADDEDWLVAADWPPARTGRPAAPDHVLGVGGASTMLAQCTVRPRVGRSLDVGTGCGVQAFHLARHSDSVVATDVSRRCLDLAAFNAQLNGLELDLRQGSLLEPVSGERFDLVVSNPPFVVGSPRRERHDYRDSGMPGDEVCARLVAGAADVLADGGWFQLLANWEVREGEEWATRPWGWLDGSPLDAWVVQRDVQDPAAYVETWLRDSGDATATDYRARVDDWLTSLEARAVVGIGFGLVTLRAGGLTSPVRRFQHAPQQLVQPVGADVEAWFARQDVLAGHPDADVLTLPLRTGSDVVVDLRYRPGADAPDAVVAQRQTGFAWSGALDAFGHSVLDAADGSRSIGEVVALLAEADGLDVPGTLAASVPVVRRLLEEGFLVPPVG